MITIKKIKYYLKKFLLDKNDSDFINHNKKIFTKNGKDSDSIVLFELNEVNVNVIAYSYFAFYLSKKYNAKIYSFFPRIPRGLLKKLIWKYREKFNFKTSKLFTSFGADRMIIPFLSDQMLIETEEIFSEKIDLIKTKENLEELNIFDITFGDLIYDYYLTYYKESEIDILSDKFKNHLRYCIQLIVYWNRSLCTNNVKAVSVSHTVYSNAIPIRIAIEMGIPSFQTTSNDIYRLSKKRRFAYTEFKDFRRMFSLLSKEKQNAGIEEAKKRVESRFLGDVGVDMSYSKKSAFGEKLDFRLIKKSSKIKILVAPHCFFDSPHPFGNNLFPDVLEWLKQLVQISEKTDYDWYVKTHPDFIKETKEVVEKFFKNHRQFTILPSNSSHNQIIDEGVNFALTMYGTIGFEYAAKNKPVINASLNNPHIAYDFNINPKSREEYIEILMNLNDVRHPININDVYEYYYMKHLYSSKSWLFKNYSEMIEILGGESKLLTSSVFYYWIENWSQYRHNEILSNLESFIDSGDYKFDLNQLTRKP